MPTAQIARNIATGMNGANEATSTSNDKLRGKCDPVTCLAGIFSEPLLRSAPPSVISVPPGGVPHRALHRPRSWLCPPPPARAYPASAGAIIARPLPGLKRIPGGCRGPRAGCRRRSWAVRPAARACRPFPSPGTSRPASRRPGAAARARRGAPAGSGRPWRRGPSQSDHDILSLREA